MGADVTRTAGDEPGHVTPQGDQRGTHPFCRVLRPATALHASHRTARIPPHWTMAGMTHLVVMAPDSFKGTIGAADAAAALGRGWKRVRRHDRIRLLPMADGGEGTLAAFATPVPGARAAPSTGGGRRGG